MCQEKHFENLDGEWGWESFKKLEKKGNGINAGAASAGEQHLLSFPGSFRV